MSAVSYHHGKFPPTGIDWERLVTSIDCRSQMNLKSICGSFLGFREPQTRLLLAPTEPQFTEAWKSLRDHLCLQPKNFLCRMRELDLEILADIDELEGMLR